MRFGYLAAAACCITLIPAATSAAGYEQQFPYPKEAVYRELVAAIPTLGMKVNAEDPMLARVVAAAGVSAWSWGENMSIAVVDAGPGKSVLQYESKRVLGTNIADGGRSLKLFNKIVLEVSRRLQASGPPAS